MNENHVFILMLVLTSFLGVGVSALSLDYASLAICGMMFLVSLVMYKIESRLFRMEER